MSEKLINYTYKSNVCRCCLSNCGTMDLTDTYITENGSKEVFSDILQQCFGITLSYLNESQPSKLVCDTCITHIREAKIFHEQVLQADKQFELYWKNTCNVEKNGNTIKDQSDDIKKVRKRQKHLKQRTRTEDSDDSNIEGFKTEEYDEALENATNDDGIMVEIPITQIKTKTQNVKLVSERKRVILTCNIVLKDTTACPFRHYKSWFQCFFCTREFIEMNDLRTHTQESHADIDGELKKIKRYPRSLQIDISNLECRHCNLTLTDVQIMKCHFVQKHDKIIYNECIADYKVNSSPYNCHLCNREFHAFRTLTTHINEHYANCICDVCGKSYINSKRLKVHKRIHEKGEYPCKECDKIFKNKTAKANHMESAHSKRVLKCQICFKPMKHYNDRVKHMSEVHNITHKFKCNICGRVYNIKHYLATHLRQTHGNKNKKCIECGMAFITNHGLKKHMLKHSGEKPYKCTVCSKSYARSYTLKEHMRVHNVESLS